MVTARLARVSPGSGSSRLGRGAGSQRGQGGQPSVREERKGARTGETPGMRRFIDAICASSAFRWCAICSRNCLSLGDLECHEPCFFRNYQSRAQSAGRNRVSGSQRTLFCMCDHAIRMRTSRFVRGALGLDCCHCCRRYWKRGRRLCLRRNRRNTVRGCARAPGLTRARQPRAGAHCLWLLLRRSPSAPALRPQLRLHRLPARNERSLHIRSSRKKWRGREGGQPAWEPKIFEDNAPSPVGNVSRGQPARRSHERGDCPNGGFAAAWRAARKLRRPRGSLRPLLRQHVLVLGRPFLLPGSLARHRARTTRNARSCARISDL